MTDDQLRKIPVPFARGNVMEQKIDGTIAMLTKGRDMIALDDSELRTVLLNLKTALEVAQRNLTDLLRQLENNRRQGRGIHLVCYEQMVDERRGSETPSGEC